MRRLMSCFVFGFVLLGGLRAQTANDGPPTEDLVSVQFRLMAWEGDVPALSYGRHQTVALTEAASRSDIQSYTGPARLTFTLAGQKTDARKPPPVVASVLLPKDARRLTLLTVPAGRGHYGMYVIPEGAAALPSGHVRLHNLTHDRLLIGYNATERIELAPGASALVAAPGKALVIQVARMIDGRWRALFNNVIELVEAGGPNVLLIHGQQGAGIGMFALPAWPAPAKDAAAP